MVKVRTTFVLGCLSAFSLFVFAFLLGAFVVQEQIFPYNVLRDAQLASSAVRAVAQEDKQGPPYQQGVERPTVLRASLSDDEDLILVCGGAHYLQSYHPAGCVAWLMDRKGNVKHYWAYDPNIWAHLPNARMAWNAGAYPVGAHLYPDGGLLVSFQALNFFPYGVGLARYDRQSKLLWHKVLHSHHWCHVAEDGRIFVPAHRIVRGTVPIGATAGRIESRQNAVYQDLILILTAEGDVIDEIPVLEALCRSGWEGLIWHWKEPEYTEVVDAHDPVHLNDVRVATSEDASRVPGTSPGDVLVSLRNLNAIGILDPKTRQFTRMSAGASVHQHSPRFFEDGVLVFDNHGGAKQHGGSRLVKIDLDGHRPITMFPTTEKPVPQPELLRKFHSPRGGHLDIHRDRRRVLVVLMESGAIWEIDFESGKVVWEYVYVQPVQDRPNASDNGRRNILSAQYVYRPSFPFNVPTETN
ncbi:MAG: arylsulfotransferase family protein [Planctomycetaceae bacterium]